MLLQANAYDARVRSSGSNTSSEEPLVKNGEDDSDVDSDLGARIQQEYTVSGAGKNSAAPSRKLQVAILSLPPPQKNPEEGDTQALSDRS